MNRGAAFFDLDRTLMAGSSAFEFARAAYKSGLLPRRALVVASDEWASANGKEALAEVVAHAQSANDFAYLATTPASAAKKALAKAGLEASDIDLWEINEAFASVTLNSIRLLGIDEEKVNVNGGAVALGHPIGASGARILGVLVHELRRRGGGLGCAAICSGGGQGDAVILRVPPQ